MAIQGSEPLVEPEKTFDRYWMNLRTFAPSPDRSAAIEITLRPYNVDEYGAPQDISTNLLKFRVDDLFAEAASNSELATTLGMLFNCVQNMAIARGIIH